MFSAVNVKDQYLFSNLNRNTVGGSARYHFISSLEKYASNVCLPTADEFNVNLFRHLVHTLLKSKTDILPERHTIQ